MSKPLWQKRTKFSHNRNISVVIWPEQPNNQGGTFPPSIAIEEGKNEGTQEVPKWKNKTMYLSKDKLPTIIADLQFAYSFLLQLDSNGEFNTTPVTPKADYDLAGRIYKTVCAEQRISAAAVTLANQYKATAEEVKAAVEKLEREKLVKIEIDGLKPYLVLLPR